MFLGLEPVMKKTRFYTLSITLSFGLLSGCYAGAQTRATIVVPVESQPHTTTIVRRHAPPPHAPAHGYRYRHYDNDLQYDSGFGAYIVIGTPGLYFYGGNYMRRHNNRWQITGRLRNAWRPAGEHDIPLLLRNTRPHNAAPRHGFRRTYQGHELSYDTGVGAYAIIDRPGVYFHNNRYLRRHNGVWQSSKKLNGGWLSATERHVPRKLKKAKHSKKQWKKKYRQKRKGKH